MNEASATEPTPMHTSEDVIHRVVAEYREMPGLLLTVDQVGRLCGIERVMCQRVLDALVSATFLILTPNGHYARVTDGPRMRSVKADLSIPRVSAKAS
jgi:hypothetical protein